MTTPYQRFGVALHFGARRVNGISKSASGVSGHSNEGSGIFGSSNTSYAGAFTSDFAQIRLIPSSEESLGPPESVDHQEGEFFVDKDGGLFYCFDGNSQFTHDRQGLPATPNWRELVLRPKNTFGPPTTGKHTTGEFYVDKQARLWFCVDEGHPGSWKEIKLYERSAISELLDRFTGLLSRIIRGR